MVSYTVKQTVVENLNADLDGKQPAGDYPTNASLTESLQSNLFNYTTNRILEIPQDIKLESNNDTLTLKAGSKVYAPNGFENDGVTPKFDVKTVTNDLSWDLNQADALCFVTPDNTQNTVLRDHCFSGSTAPTSFQSGQYAIWYDTTNNFVKFTNDAGSTWSTGTSLPYTSISSDDSYNTFNGFGYIGSTVFALPGIKVQISDNRNIDGTCKNIIFSNDTVKTFTQGNVTRVEGVWFGLGGLGLSPFLYYDSENNIIKSSSDNITRQKAKLAECLLENGKITSFTPCYVDSFANSNASNFSKAGESYLSSMSMPFNKYIDLTPGASETTYTAPANGWFFMDVGLTDAKGAAQLSCGAIGASAIPQTGVSPSYALLPAHAGNVVKLTYGLSAKFNAFRFIYSKGEQ